MLKKYDHHRVQRKRTQTERVRNLQYQLEVLLVELHLVSISMAAKVGSSVALFPCHLIVPASTQLIKPLSQSYVVAYIDSLPSVGCIRSTVLNCVRGDNVVSCRLNSFSLNPLFFTTLNMDQTLLGSFCSSLIQLYMILNGCSQYQVQLVRIQLRVPEYGWTTQKVFHLMNFVVNGCKACIYCCCSE